MWAVRARLGELALGHRAAEVAEAIDGALHGEPRKALLALTGSEAAGDATASLIIRAGLAWADLEDAHDAAAPLWTMRDALPAALLSAADAEWSEDEVEAAIGVCGDIVPELLNGKDRYASSGRIDEAAEVFDRNPEMREEFVRRAGLIPQGILSADSRVIAAMELVKERRSPRLEWLMGHARSVHTDTERMIRMLRDPVAEASFDARRTHAGASGWRLVPGISLGLALVARHAARGNTVAATWLQRQARVWADIAGVLPQMVTTDLIIAELLVTGSARIPQEKP